MTLPPDLTPAERAAAFRRRLLARGPRRSWCIADYGPPAPGEPSAMPVGHRESVSRDENLDLWHAWMAQDNATFSFGPFATEAEARGALAHPETWL